MGHSAKRKRTESPTAENAATLSYWRRNLKQERLRGRSYMYNVYLSMWSDPKCTPVSNTVLNFDILMVTHTRTQNYKQAGAQKWQQDHFMTYWFHMPKINCIHACVFVFNFLTYTYTYTHVHGVEGGGEGERNGRTQHKNKQEKQKEWGKDDAGRQAETYIYIKPVNHNDHIWAKQNDQITRKMSYHVCVRGLGEGEEVNKHTSEKMTGIGKLDVLAGKQVIKFATPSQPRESPQQENEPGRRRLERHDSWQQQQAERTKLSCSLLQRKPFNAATAVNY